MCVMETFLFLKVLDILFSFIFFVRILFDIKSDIVVMCLYVQPIHLNLKTGKTATTEWYIKPQQASR